MCFSIPVKIQKINGKMAIIEGGRNIRLDNSLEVETGDYVRLVGDIVVDTMSRKNALKIRKLIKRLNT